MENSKPGTPIVSVVAEDEDVDRLIQYSLHGPPEIVGEWPGSAAGSWQGRSQGLEEGVIMCRGRARTVEMYVVGKRTQSA